MTPGFAKSRRELFWLPYPEPDKVIINSHNFTQSYLYPSLRTSPPAAGYAASLDTGASASDQFTVDGTQDGTLVNGVARTDVTGLAYDFTRASSQYIDCGAFAALDGISKYTLAFWGKKKNTGTTIPVGKRNASAYCGVDVWSDAKIYFQISPGFGTHTLDDTSWHHYCMVFDGTVTGNSNRLKGYVDGVQKTLTFGGGSIPATTPAAGNFHIGQDAQGGPDRYGNCYIDDVVVYAAVALDSTNVGYLAAQRKAIYATA